MRLIHIGVDPSRSHEAHSSCPGSRPAREVSEQTFDPAVLVDVDALGRRNLRQPGIVIMSPQTAHHELRPAESRSSRTGTSWPSGAPLRDGSVEKLYWVFAMHTGKWPYPPACNALNRLRTIAGAVMPEAP